VAREHSTLRTMYHIFDLGRFYLSLTDYVNYVKDAVQDIKDKTGTAKVTILGYCWGGIIALIYAALNNENLRSWLLR
jgi:polyhydroxyalkanoate synthase subunit PhaC